MHSVWRTYDDFIQDIMAISEIESVGRDEEPPESIREYRAQMAANNTGSIYDAPEPEDENVTYIISGRGRGGISTILRPGVSHLSDSLVTEDVLRKLRQVSGLGYSNELIEQGVRAMTIANDKSNNPPSPLTQDLPSTSRSPLRKTPSSPRLEKDRSSSSCSSLSSNSGVENHGQPPPLSLMRKKAQEERQRDKNKVIEKAKVTKTSEKREMRKVKLTNINALAPNSGVSSTRRDISRSSSDEGPWGRRNGNFTNASFQNHATNFNLSVDDFPVLK